jgi:hypothetical protein
LISKRPHTASISYPITDGTFNTYREFTAGTETTFQVACDIQTMQPGRYMQTAGGDSVPTRFRVFIDRFDGDTDVPRTGVRMTVFDEEINVIQFITYQKHIEVYL